MMLRKILQGCDYKVPHAGDEAFTELDAQGVTYDSRNVAAGCLFVAIRGERYDGHDFVGDAIGKGAVAAVVEHALPEVAGNLILVKDARRALACIANNFYERPSEHLTMTGVTGTNGKTTTTYLLKSILEAWKKSVGLIGTIRYMIKDDIIPASHTTPESLEFQGLLKRMLLSGCTHIVTEVSSHALAQRRVEGTIFQTAVFTNLTRDHLDFHKTFEDYCSAKERLFKDLLTPNGTAVLNLDDAYGQRLDSELRRARPDLRILTYGLGAGAALRAGDVEVSSGGSKFQLSFSGKEYHVTTRLAGMPNVYNIMSATGASISLGVPWPVILAGIADAPEIPGRFEKVEAGQKFLCIIDYAHTEDALERLINTARQLISSGRSSPAERNDAVSQDAGRRRSRIITVFGCGGDRDRGKRPRMGEIATELSDFVIITTDNPRSEDAMNIIRDIESGAAKRNYRIDPDRKEAIGQAVAMAEEGDIVLVAGKGHEDYQEIKGLRYPFSDIDVAMEKIRSKLRTKNVG